MNPIRSLTRWSPEWLNASSDEALEDALQQAVSNASYIGDRNPSRYFLWARRAEDVKNALKERPLP